MNIHHKSHPWPTAPLAEDKSGQGENQAPGCGTAAA